MVAGPPPARRPGPRPWWESRVFIAALILLSALPLLYPPIPPLVDMMGHMGRFRVQLDLETSPWLQQYYALDWQPIGNLGIDLLLFPLTKLIGLEAAVKLVVLAIPPLTVAGFLWVAREVHGRLPATALFALPFAYGHPFMFGFVNFALSMALAFLAFGLWLRLGRLGRTALRAWLFVPISILIFFTHAFGWGTLGLLAFSAEAVRRHDRGVAWAKAGATAALNASVMALPLLVMVVWRTDSGAGITADWFNWEAKLEWLMRALRDRWQWFDLASVLVALLVVIEAIRNRRLGFSRNLAFTALVLTACFVLLPRIIFGSAYADMRLAPYIFAVALLAIRFRDATHRHTAQLLAVAGLAFFLVRIGGNTVSLAIASNEQQQLLTALDHVPQGAAVATLAGRQCGMPWQYARDTHLGGMVIVRKQGFSNDQWVMEGLNPLRLRFPDAGRFGSDPSQIVVPAECANPEHWSPDQALRTLPRDAFDYLWLIDPPEFDRQRLDGLERLWSEGDSALFRINPVGAGPPRATRRTAGETGR